jgi:hypothetical protein
MFRPLAALPWAVVAALFAQSPDPASRVVDRIVAGEQDFLARAGTLRPILEAYLQEVADDGSPESDHYLIGRFDLSDGPDVLPFLSSAAFQKRSRLFGRRPGSRLQLSPAGFAQMVVPDADDFDRETYSFEYARREFLGELRCLVFDVAPRDRKAAGRFLGRIWVEDQDYRIVRFNGTYTRSQSSSVFLHFDSWRINVGPGRFVPAFVYIEDARPRHKNERPLRLKGHVRLWGYNAPRAGTMSELTSVVVRPDDPVRDRTATQDLSPLESHRSWMSQAEENVVERLERAGLLAPRGEVEQVLDTVLNNLLVTSNLNLEVQARVLLTTPLETFSVGRTIVISRGLLDVLPDEAGLAVFLAAELAHLVLGHQTETMFAFSDRTLFPETEILQQLRFARPAEEITSANQRAMEILGSSPYKDRLPAAGLFLKALAARAPRLPNLIQPNLGNQITGGDGLLRLASLAAQAPPLEEYKLEQIAALPLGSRVRLDPWTNRIVLMKTRPALLLSPRDKMPFQVTPIIPHLTRAAPAPESAEATGRSR